MRGRGSADLIGEARWWRGHASAVETLNTYANLWPDSEDRIRTAIDEVLVRPADISRPAVVPEIPG